MFGLQGSVRRLFGHQATVTLITMDKKEQNQYTCNKAKHNIKAHK